MFAIAVLGDRVPVTRALSDLRRLVDSIVPDHTLTFDALDSETVGTSIPPDACDLCSPSSAMARRIATSLIAVLRFCGFGNERSCLYLLIVGPKSRVLVVAYAS